MDKVEQIFEEANKKLLPEHKGDIIAIDEESGDYDLGKSIREVYNKLVKRHPNKTFYFKRLGFDYVYFVGAKNVG